MAEKPPPYSPPEAYQAECAASPYNTAPPNYQPQPPPVSNYQPQPPPIPNYQPHPPPPPPPPPGLKYQPQPSPGYCHVPESALPNYGSTVYLQPQPAHTTQVIFVGGCPACRVGVLEDDFTCLGVCLAIFLFPLGILCCLALRQRRCPNCGAIFG